VTAEAMIGHYDYRLVALSVLIAVFASYTALDLAGRTTAARGRIRLTWLAGGATAMAVGIWSYALHRNAGFQFTGAGALRLADGIAVGSWPPFRCCRLFVTSGKKMGWPRAVAGSAIMCSGIATMHYTGMAAMRLPAMCSYDLRLLILSVVLAIVISLVALWLTFRFREDTGLRLVEGGKIPTFDQAESVVIAQFKYSKRLAAVPYRSSEIKQKYCCTCEDPYE
jgi:NO-binding membrane sensor protein with MHYT domain